MTELTIFSVGAAHGFLDLVAPQVAAAMNIFLRVDYGPIGDTSDKVRNRIDGDAAILSDAALRELMVEGVMSGAEATAIGIVEAAIAVRAGDPSIDFHNLETMQNAFRSAPAIFVPNMTKSTAGKHFREIALRLGMRELLSTSVVECDSGTSAMKRLATSSLVGALGFTQSTEICSTQGLQLCTALPADYRLVTKYYAARCSRSHNPIEVSRFLQFLQQTRSRAALISAGFQPDDEYRIIV